MRNRGRKLGLLFLAGLFATGLVGSVPTVATSSPESTVVTSIADSGPGTLRQALLDAESGDTITFDGAVFPPSSPATIYVTSGLPSVNQGNLTIDASNAGVIVDGSNLAEGWVNGLEVVSNGNTIQGLQVSNFSGAGVALSGGAEYNTIGGRRSVGTGPFGQGNQTTGNSTGIGIWDDDTSFNTITGNLVGTDAGGTPGLGNTEGVAILERASDNTIGRDNVIAHNDLAGVNVRNTGSVGNAITANSIHDNGGMGIALVDGGNSELAAPRIFEFDLRAGTVTGATCANCTVEVFSDGSDEGRVYEGQTTANAGGVFAFNKGAAFMNPSITSTASDASGNTSEFSSPAAITLQEGNTLSRLWLLTRPSSQLIADTRLGGSLYSSGIWGDIPNLDSILNDLTGMSIKRLDTSMQEVEEPIDWNRSEYEVPPEYDRFVDDLNENGVAVNYMLHFWDKAGHASGKELSTPRFKTEEQIEDFLDYVRFVVSHFEGRVQYYTIWSEPDYCEGSRIKCIEPNDYMNLVKKTIPVVRQEDPQAKVALAPNVLFFARERVFSILKSDVIPMFDVIQWHGIYDVVPDSEFYGNYYYEYPAIIEEIKQTANAHGFTGEFWGTELSWSSEEFPAHPPDQRGIQKTDKLAAKYLARVFVIQLGMDVGVSTHTLYGSEPWTCPTIRNLYAVMAGTTPTDLPVEIQSKATNIKSYSFSMPNGDRLLALWTDGVAVDDDPGVEATVTLSGFSAQQVTGIDVLNGFEQALLTDTDDGNLVIRNLLVKDYPVILRLEARVTRSLGGGWNQTCYIGPEQPVVQALADIMAGVHAVYRPNSSQAFDRWFPDRPEVSNIETIKPYEPLFVLMSKDAAWSQSPSGTPPTSANLAQGWNSTCYLGQTMAAGDATVSIASQLGVLYTLGSDQIWGRYVPDRPEVSNIAQLTQYDAVLVLVNAEGGAQWIFNP